MTTHQHPLSWKHPFTRVDLTEDRIGYQMHVLYPVEADGEPLAPPRLEIRLLATKDLKKASMHLTLSRRAGKKPDLHWNWPLSGPEFTELTGYQMDDPRAVLDKLKDVQGEVTIHDGIATLPDGTQLKLAP